MPAKKSPKTKVRTGIATTTLVSLAFLGASAAFAAAAMTKISPKQSAIAPSSAPAKQVVEVKPIEVPVEKKDSGMLPDLSFYEGKPAAVTFVNHDLLRIEVVYDNLGTATALPDALHRSIDVGYQFLNKQKAPLSVPIFLISHAQLAVNAPQDMNMVVPIAANAPMQDAVYLRIVLDTESAVNESNENNNAMTVPLGNRPAPVAVYGPRVTLSASSPSGSGYPGLNEVLRFTVSANTANDTVLNAITFKANLTDNAHGGWTRATNLAPISFGRAWSLYDTTDMSTAVEGGDSDWVVYSKEDASVLNGSETVGYARLALSSPITIAAGSSKTFVLKVDTTGASSVRNVEDTVRFDLIQENDAPLNSALGILNEFDWSFRATHYAGAQGLPLIGGTIHY